MNRYITAALLGVFFIIASSAVLPQQPRNKRTSSPKPSPTPIKQVTAPTPVAADPISGEWNAVYHYRDLKIPFKLKLRLAAGIVSGEVTYDDGSRRITEGGWSAGQLNLTVEYPRDPKRPDRMTATLTENTLAGDFGPPGDTTWKAERFDDQLKKVGSKQPPEVAASLKLQLEKLLSLKISEQMEGAFNLGEMGSKALPAVPFLLATLPLSGGVKEVDRSSLRFLGETTVGLATGEKVYTVYPVQNVTVRALAKIGEPAIEPIRLLLLKEPPEAESVSFALDALARMQNPIATKLLHEMARSKNTQLRRKVVDSLAENKSPGTVELLIEFLNDAEPVIRADAAGSLQRNTGKNFGQDAARWKEWWSNNIPKP